MSQSDQRKIENFFVELHGEVINQSIHVDVKEYEEKLNKANKKVLEDKRRCYSNLQNAKQELEMQHFRMIDLVEERTAELRRANKRLKQEVEIRLQAEHELLELAERLKLSNEELEQFAHVASHDLKEPLTLVLAFGERLLAKHAGQLDSKAVDYIDRILKAATQMSCLVNDLLELSRVSTVNHDFELIDLTHLVHEVVQSLEERINLVGGRVDISQLGYIEGDPTQMRQLFQNIISNALKYSKNTNLPKVAVKRCAKRKNFCEIHVEDNGIGFDPFFAEKIFTPFARLHGRKEYEGTGMGLATCHKIVVRHGGKISAKSVPGEGATFIIRLPLRSNYE